MNECLYAYRPKVHRSSSREMNILDVDIDFFPDSRIQNILIHSLGLLMERFIYNKHVHEMVIYCIIINLFRASNG